MADYCLAKIQQRKISRILASDKKLSEENYFNVCVFDAQTVFSHDTDQCVTQTSSFRSTFEIN